MNHRLTEERGFTLLETIITLVIVAIMSTMLFTYFRSTSSSVTPVQWVQFANSIHLIMERITADYQGYPHWKPNTPYTTGSRITPLRRNGYFYQPIANCTSGAAEPSAWDTTPGSGVQSTDAGGGCTWTPPANTVQNPNPIITLAALRLKIAGGAVDGIGENQTVDYNNDATTGMRYRIVNNRYIDPATSWDTASGAATSYLKVTIQSANSAEKLTAIFTQ